jgi:hypothetical protein
MTRVQDGSSITPLSGLLAWVEPDADDALLDAFFVGAIRVDPL